MASAKQVENLRLRSSDDLCRLAEVLGYKGAVDQLQCRNGAFVSSLLAFFDDNPGVMEAIQEWVLENSSLNEEDSCEECGEDLADGKCANEDCDSFEDPPESE